MATFTAVVMCLLFSGIHICVWGILLCWSACAPTAYEWSTIAISLRNIAI
jgi:hypothetical protein